MLKMMIVVEGVDGSGKTHVISRLCELMPDLKVRPRSTGSDTKHLVPMAEWVQEERNIYKADGGEIIYDRHALISECIYGPTLRQKFPEGFDTLKWLTHQIKKFWMQKPIVIICMPPLETVVLNMAQDDFPVENIEVYYWYYHAWLANNNPYPMTHQDRNILVWDYTTMDFSELVEDIERLERANQCS